MNSNIQKRQPVSNIADAKFPFIYIVKIKRGVAWSLRRIELDKNSFKYFKIGK
jgi:hypothetical protein